MLDRDRNQCLSDRTTRAHKGVKSFVIAYEQTLEAVCFVKLYVEESSSKKMAELCLIPATSPESLKFQVKILPDDQAFYEERGQIIERSTACYLTGFYCLKKKL